MKPNPKLNRFIEKAHADYERALQDFGRKKTTASKKVLGQLEAKVTIASQTLKQYEALPSMPESKMVAMLEEARKDREQARRYEYRNPPLAQSLLESAHSRGQRYLLWCDYHGRTPAKELSGVTMDEPAETVQPTGRGGKRPNAGRPALGHVQMLLKCKPETAQKLRALAKSEGMTLGGWFDSHIDSLRPDSQ